MDITFEKGGGGVCVCVCVGGGEGRHYTAFSSLAAETAVPEFSLFLSLSLTPALIYHALSLR